MKSNEQGRSGNAAHLMHTVLHFPGPGLHCKLPWTGPSSLYLTFQVSFCLCVLLVQEDLLFVQPGCWHLLSIVPWQRRKTPAPIAGLSLHHPAQSLQLYGAVQVVRHAWCWCAPRFACRGVLRLWQPLRSLNFSP